MDSQVFGGHLEVHVAGQLTPRGPELVEKYADVLEDQWQAHMTMAALFETGVTVALTPEQLKTLRTLGHI